MNDDSSGFWIGLIFCVIAFTAGHFAGWNKGISYHEKECIAAGVAEYRVSQEGEVTFHWKK